jgi:hypothetical protein
MPHADAAGTQLDLHTPLSLLKFRAIRANS